jgi:hypothetical protein
VKAVVTRKDRYIHVYLHVLPCTILILVKLEKSC